MNVFSSKNISFCGYFLLAYSLLTILANCAHHENQIETTQGFVIDDRYLYERSNRIKIHALIKQDQDTGVHDRRFLYYDATILDNLYPITESVYKLNDSKLIEVNSDNEIYVMGGSAISGETLADEKSLIAQIQSHFPKHKVNNLSCFVLDLMINGNCKTLDRVLSLEKTSARILYFLIQPYSLIRENCVVSGKMDNIMIDCKKADNLNSHLKMDLEKQLNIIEQLAKKSSKKMLVYTISGISSQASKELKKIPNVHHFHFSYLKISNAISPEIIGLKPRLIEALASEVKKSWPLIP